jgi:hypothetical protein
MIEIRDVAPGLWVWRTETIVIDPILPSGDGSHRGGTPAAASVAR